LRGKRSHFHLCLPFVSFLFSPAPVFHLPPPPTNFLIFFLFWGVCVHLLLWTSGSSLSDLIPVVPSRGLPVDRLRGPFGEFFFFFSSYPSLSGLRLISGSVFNLLTGPILLVGPPFSPGIPSLGEETSLIFSLIRRS